MDAYERALERETVAKLRQIVKEWREGAIHADDEVEE